MTETNNIKPGGMSFERSQILSGELADKYGVPTVAVIDKGQSYERLCDELGSVILGLERGDIVKNQSNDKTYVVTANYGERVTAVATVDMTNPDEWELVLKANHVQPVDSELK